MTNVFDRSDISITNIGVSLWEKTTREDVLSSVAAVLDEIADGSLKVIELED